MYGCAGISSKSGIFLSTFLILNFFYFLKKFSGGFGYIYQYLSVFYGLILSILIYVSEN